jgi:hypothetical protein
MKTMTLIFGFLAAGLLIINPCSGQANDDSMIAARAYRALKRANIANAISIGFGTASNIEMMAIGGFPLEVDYGQNPALNFSHMFLGIGRIVTSISPPAGVSKARRLLEPWRKSPEMEASCKKLFSTLDAAQVLTAAAPVLGISGGIMMITASLSHQDVWNTNTDTWETRTSKPGLKTTGWILVGAGLAASFSSAILIGIAKRDLSRKIGSFKMAAGPTGVGLQYNLPVKH